jgi:UDP-N-acetylglucosamine 2-epimerase
VGSLSADAVDLAITRDLEDTRERILDRIPDGKWLRVDLHRRENMSFAKVKAILEGLARFSELGGRVLLVNTNAFRAAVTKYNLVDLLQSIERKSGVLVHEMWPSYLDVIAFMQSDRCLALYTDSGGLQEEANVLGVHCITCRYSTDRPETVLDGLTNILLPPANESLVCNGLEALLSAPAHQVWPGLKSDFLYSKQVGQRIALLLSEYVPPPPVDGAGIVF